MDDLIKKLKGHVMELSNNNLKFKHHDWFVKYHLVIVEKIAHELCEKYTSADKDVVTVMVWMHDYGKIVDFDNQYSLTLTAGKDKLLELGFPEDFTNTVLNYIEILDKKENLIADTTPIEIKIVSSSDGAAHHVGPFYYLWWHENPGKNFEELMEDNVRKLNKDWDKKIVLPEVIQAFSARRDFLLEQTGTMPEKFL